MYPTSPRSIRLSKSNSHGPPNPHAAPSLHVSAFEGAGLELYKDCKLLIINMDYFSTYVLLNNRLLFK
jgi:hypothetical protein